MALTTAQQALLLFKKWLGVGQSTIAREFYQEPYIGKSAILASQVWQESARDGEKLTVVIRV